MNFDTRGVTTPFGTLGVIYFTSSLDNTAVAAVTVTRAVASGAGSTGRESGNDADQDAAERGAAFP